MFGLDTNYLGLTGDIKVRTSRGISDDIDKDGISKGIEHIHKYKVIRLPLDTKGLLPDRV